MHDKPDIKNSIQQKRLIFKKNLIEIIAERLISIALLFAFPFFSIMFLLIQKKEGGSTDLGIICLIISILFSAYALFGMINLNRMRKVRGAGYQENKNVIKTFMKPPAFKISRSNNCFESAIEHDGSMRNFGRVYSIIYDEQDVYVNCTTLGGIHRFRSPLHGISNRICENRIINEIKKNTPNTP